MDTNWIEYLLPIIFFVLYGISKLFGKGEDDKSGAPATPPDESERQRKIQDEIRRRIAERQQETVEDEPSPTLTPPMPTFDRPTATQRSPFSIPIPPEPRVTPMREPEPPAAIDLQKQLTAQMERLREANRESERVQQPMTRKAQRDDYSLRKKRGSKSTFRREITSMLEDSKSARKAFLYSEIFGTPMGQRRQSTFAPLVDQ